MIKGTTPTILINIKGSNLQDSTPYVTIKQGSYELTKSGKDLIKSYDDNSCTLAIELSQEDTLGFDADKAEIQVRWVYESGKAWATTIKTIQIKQVLLDEVIEYATT